MMEFISSAFGASMNAKPFDSCVSGLQGITLIGVSDQVLSCEPALDVVRGYPSWQVT